ncbi:MAG TPA: hypothetical protein EYO33_06840 [Phycisphaerales bacterium]|nr:hypothetical protein [Phycisphaerales bacterium]
MAVLTQALTFTLIPDGQLNDDAAYVLRAMKLAFPHRFDFLRSAPTDYPFGWPLVLVPFYWLSDQFYTIGRLVAVVLTGLTSMLLFSIFKENSPSFPPLPAGDDARLKPYDRAVLLLSYPAECFSFLPNPFHRRLPLAGPSRSMVYGH